MVERDDDALCDGPEAEALLRGLPRSAVYYPMTDGRTGRRQLLVRVLGWALVATLVVAGGLAGGAYLYFRQSLAAVAAHSTDVRRAQKHLAAALPGRAAIALLLGYDHRANEADNTPSRSDTMMLIRADPKTKTISLLSLPRDLYVPIHCPGRAVFDSKINAAYANCGAQGSLATVGALTGSPINYLITVNFHGFKEIVDRLGGIWLDIDHRYFNNQGGPNGYATIDLFPGYQKLSGSDALDYVRFRHTDSDLIRVERQQQFVKAFKQQIAQSFSPFSLPGIVGALTHSVEVGVGGGGSLSPGTLLSWALFAYQLPGGHIAQSKIENINSIGATSDLQVNQDAVNAAVHDFLNPAVAAAKTDTALALGQAPPRARAAHAPPRTLTTVAVLNGNGVPGAASNASYLLQRQGYRIVLPTGGRPANAPAWTYQHTTVYFDPRQPGTRAAAAAIAGLFGNATVTRLPNEIASLANGAMVVAAVGQTFHGALAPLPAAASPPKHEPARVLAHSTVNSSAAALLRQAQPQVPFPLLNPTAIDDSSMLDPTMPIRVYPISRGIQSVRLVFRQGYGDYWGIEETPFAKAAALSGASLHRVSNGRSYDLYYSAHHLHMIVLRQHSTSYWVINSLSDNLSNETMLSIAQGLRPISTPGRR